MHFCKQCDNMYYIQLSNETSNSLIYYCRNCGDKSDLVVDNINVTNGNSIGSQKNKMIVNRYTKLDPSLPRITNILCPNVSCVSNTNNEVHKEVIYIRGDDVNMEYVYICSHCTHVWSMTPSK